jgi:hypothetical protein
MLSKETILKGHSKFGVSINFDLICAYLKYNILILLARITILRKCHSNTFQNCSNTITTYTWMKLNHISEKLLLPQEAKSHGGN